MLPSQPLYVRHDSNYCITSYYKIFDFCKSESIFFFEIFVVNLYSQKSD